MIYKLDADFQKIEENDGIMQNKSRRAKIEIVATSGAPEKDTGLSLKPGEKLTFSVKTGQSLYARCESLKHHGANLSVVNFKKPATGGTIAGAATGTILYGHFVMPGCVKASGQLLSREEYAELFSCASENGLILSEEEWADGMQGMYGEGDGKSTFRVPDFRGQFLRCADELKGVDSNRSVGSLQEDAIRDITGEFTVTDNINYPCNPEGAFKFKHVTGLRHNIGEDSGMRVQFSAGNVVPTAEENRPKNIALIAQIKY